MNCDAVTKLIPLYYYGELTPDEEDQLDQHVHECSACATRMEQQQTLAAALDRRVADIPPLLLEDCRQDLLAAIAGGAPPHPPRPAKGPWALFLEAMGATLAGFGRLRQPVGALLLVLLGFVAARYSGANFPAPSAVPGDNAFANVRSISETNGVLHILMDETQRREVTGRLDDPKIQNIILAASRDENNADVRLKSVDLMKSRPDNPQVLDSLLNTVASDPVDAVRLKALDVLKPVASDPRVIKTLSQVLLTDPNAAMRMQVIDLMTTRRDDSAVGVLQNLMQREDNSAVRLKASKILKDWNASIGTF